MLEAASPEERERIIPNHLAKSTEFVETFVKTGIESQGNHPLRPTTRPPMWPTPSMTR